MQVDPFKPTLKAPGIKHLKLNCDILLSNFALNFNLRCYSSEAEDERERATEAAQVALQKSQAGAYTRPLFSST